MVLIKSTRFEINLRDEDYKISKFIDERNIVHTEVRLTADGKVNAEIQIAMQIEK